MECETSSCVSHLFPCRGCHRCRNSKFFCWESRAIKGSLFSWSGSDYSLACFTYFQEFYRCNFSFPGSFNFQLFFLQSSSSIKVSSVKNCESHFYLWSGYFGLTLKWPSQFKGHKISIITQSHAYWPDVNHWGVTSSSHHPLPQDRGGHAAGPDTRTSGQVSSFYQYVLLFVFQQVICS